MTTILRDYQLALKAAIYEQWRGGARNVLAVLPTGAGKTTVFADVIRDLNCATAAIAHRQELVTQMSVALARAGVRHGVVAPDAVRRLCVSLHMEEVGRSFYDPRALTRVAGVDTLVRVDPATDPWFAAVRLWVQDEAHHLLTANKWGKASTLFPHAYGLGVTATPMRADGQGLGRVSDGVMDALVEGPSMRETITRGYLTDYRIFAPPSDVVYDDVPVTASGDYSPAKLREAVHRSGRIVGDIVGHYLAIAKGKLGITFAVDVEAAVEIAAAFRKAGVPAEVVSAKTPDHLRVSIMRRFKAREVLQLVNVDLFGEGVDVPACEVVSMARKTESYGLYVQQFGRALRVLVSRELGAVWHSITDAQRVEAIAKSTKPKAVIIDHAGNVIRHGLPDAPREWSLERRESKRRGASDAVPLRACPQCTAVYERYLRTCPYCGHYPEPPARTDPAAVDGDLYELTPETLMALRGEVERIDGLPPNLNSMGAVVARGALNQHHERQAAQMDLRTAMAHMGGAWKAQGHTDAEMQRLFFHRFGLDVMSAQALGRPKAQELTARIYGALSHPTNGS